MNTEQKLDRLTALVEKLAERTEALTQSVELLASMQIDSERRMARLQEHMVSLVEGMTSLTHVVIDHRQRIENLEGNRPL